MIKYQLKTKNNISQTTDFNTCELSVLIGMDNLSYAIYDRKVVDILQLNTISYPFTQDPNVLLNHVKELFAEEKVLSENFNSVKVIYQNHLCTLVPDDLYNADNHKDYLKYTVKIFENDAVKVDVIPEIQAKNLYLFPVVVEDFFSQRFSEKFYPSHQVSHLINALLRYFSKTDKDYFFVNVYDHVINMVYLKSGQLQFYNSFLYYTKEDFMYYILFVMEQLGLEPDRQALTFLGHITTDDDTYKIAHKYVRHLNFFAVDNFNISDTFYTENPDVQKHHYFELLNQL